MADRLELEARFNDHASAGVKRLGKTLDSVRPSNGMAAASKWMGDFRSAADKALKPAQQVQGVLTGIGIGGLAASLSMSELVKGLKGLSDSTLDLRELGRQSRISMTDLQRLQFVAGRFHMDPKAIDNALAGWSDKMVDFRRHTGTFYTELLRQNQDVAQKIGQASPIDALKRTLEFLAHIKDPAIQKRWAQSMDLGDLVPMLGKGPDGLAAAFADAGREVKPISQSLVDAADQLNDSTNRMNQSWTNLKNDIGPSVIDPMSKMIDHLDEVLKGVSAHPGDAAALAGVGALSATALFAQRRIMRGSALAGGGGTMGRAAGEMVGAASQQKLATTTFAEAVAEFRLGVREMAGKGGGPGGGAPSEGGKPNGASPGYASLLERGVLAAYQLFSLAEGMPEQLEKAKTDNAPMDPQVAREAGWGDALRHFFQGRGSSEAFRTPSAYDREARVRRSGLTYDAPNHDGNALHRNDEMPVSSLPARELFDTVRQGSKEGIVQGLREMAQEQELGGAGGGSFGGAAPGHGGNAGMPNLRYGRPKAGGGYRHGPGTGDGGPEGAFNPRQPDKPGTYRPQYKLSDADLSDYVVNTVNGEATSSAESIDAVINNMMNRVGSKGWGPSGNLRDVASAPGQYAGHRPASAQVAERIRDRIRAIASGGVPDNTNGSNAYRAAWYHGRWAQQHAADGRVVGGNRFAYEPWTKNGPYAPFRQPTPGAGTPAPSGAAIGDGERFAAQQRIINGSRDPKDREIIDRYKAQQAKPPGHRAGGWISGPGTGTSDSIPAMLSHGEYVINARASGQWAPLLHAINSGSLARFAQGGRAGFGVDQRFYPRTSPGISDAEGHENRRSWRDFFRRPVKDGGMGASLKTTFGALAMMAGESGRGLNSKLYDWDVNGPSGGVDQLHDVTKGRGAGRLHRLSDLMTLAMEQHVDWKDRTIQQANFRKEATGPMAFAWNRMLAAKTARGALKEGIDKFENPANHQLELLRRMPNIVKMQREAVADGAAPRQAMDPLDVTIKHHPHTGQPIVQARAGKGVKLGIRTAPMMRPT